MKRSGAIMVVAGVILGMAAFGRSEVVTLTPDADAFIYQASPDENYGRSAFIRVRNNPTSSLKSYIRFDVSGIQDRSKITAATFSISIYNDGEWTDQGVSFFGLKDRHEREGWVEGNNGKDNDPEGEITFNNAPANLPENATQFDPDDAVWLGGMTPQAGAKGYQSFSSEELVKFLQGDTDGKVTLMLSTSGKAIESFDARLRPTPPKLEITHDSPTAPDAAQPADRE